jgi:uncharacterized membrane protein YedE/YeeE
MTFLIQGNGALWLAVIFGIVFGFLLHRGRVTNYNVIVNQFRLKDFTVLKIMFTAIVVGGIGVLVLHRLDEARYHIKSADMLGVILGSAIFGVGMVIYGYCPGTGVAAVATGSVHALVGFAGMLVGGILYALSFSWIKAHILSVGKLGAVRLPELTGIPDWVWFVALAAIAIGGFGAIECLKHNRIVADAKPRTEETAKTVAVGARS